MIKILNLIITAAILLACASAHAEIIASVQGALVYPGYNDIRLPGDTGSDISFTEDLEADPVFSPRIEAGYLFNERHYAGIMASLLRFESKGKLEKNVMFDDKSFAAGTDVKGNYRFDSYRATYRYLFYRGDSFIAGAGITGKIRDADISLEGGSQKGELSNTGFVPLINFYLEWIASPVLSVILYGDALASPYGRAEDVFAGLFYRFNENFSLLAGYRILEGGADNDEVYTFSLFHYAVIGTEVRI